MSDFWKNHAAKLKQQNNAMVLALESIAQERVSPMDRSAVQFQDTANEALNKYDVIEAEAERKESV